MEEDKGGTSLSVYDEPIEKKKNEEEGNVDMRKVEGEDPFIQTGPGSQFTYKAAENPSTHSDTEFQLNYKVAQDPPTPTSPRFQFNYEVVRTLSWIFGLTLILAFVLARWSINPKQPILQDPIIIYETDNKSESREFFLDSNELSFLWKFCNRTTLECSWCPPGWIEHDSRCYLMFTHPQKWERAQEICSHYQGHLPIVLNAGDQILLTNMTYEEKKINSKVHGAWIGLTDMETEGNFIWVNGQMLTENQSFWQPGNPNNMIPYYDKRGEGQDCVGIVPPRNFKKKNWYYSWDDIVCRATRHFVCEIPIFPMRIVSYGSWERVIQPDSNKG